MSRAAAVLVWVIAMGPATGARADEPQLDLGRTRTGWFLGPKGNRLEVDAIYQAHFATPPPHHVRNILWQVGILGLGTIWYWTNAQANAADWEFTGRDFGDRFSFDGIRFDNNHFTINHISHPVAGGGYYLAARSNHYSVGYSSLIAFAMSGVWEVGLEWRERISVNDMMFTPGAGIAMGEAYYRLSHYLNSAPDGGNWVHKSLAWAIGWPVALNRWLDDVPVVDDGLSDSLGFSAAYAHRFRLAYQTVKVDGDPAGDPGQLQGFRIEGEMVAIPGFQRPGTLAILYDDGNFTQFDFGMLFVGGEAAEIDLWIDAAVWGYYQQHYSGPPDAISGTAGTLALSFAFEHVQRWLPSPQDRRAILHLPGGRLGVWSAWDGLIGHFEIGLHPDFTSIDSLAYPVWRDRHPRETARSVLEDRGYYYGWGGTTWVSADLRYGGFELEGGVRLSYANSIEGLDRHEEDITREADFEDSLIEYHGAIGFSDRVSALSSRLELTRIERAGRTEGVSRARAWNYLGFSLGLQF